MDDRTIYFAIVGYKCVRVADLIWSLGEGDAFIDIGANLGLFSLLAEQRVKAAGIVLAFEPQARVSEEFRRNLSLNSASRVHLFQFALGASTGIGRMRTSTEHTGAAHLDETGEDEVLIVNPVDILPLIVALIGSRRTVIKIDVEGAEELVARAIAPLFNVLKIETCVIEVDQNNLSRCRSSIDGLYGALQNQGFQPRFGKLAGGHYDEIFDRSETSDEPA